MPQQKHSPLGPAPADPLGAKPAVAGKTAHCPHCDATLAELRALRESVERRGSAIHTTLGLLLAGLVLWAVVVGGCRQIVEHQRQRIERLER